MKASNLYILTEQYEPVYVNTKYSRSIQSINTYWYFTPNMIFIDVTDCGNPNSLAQENPAERIKYIQLVFILLFTKHVFSIPPNK